MILLNVGDNLVYDREGDIKVKGQLVQCPIMTSGCASPAGGSGSTNSASPDGSTRDVTGPCSFRSLYWNLMSQVYYAVNLNLHFSPINFNSLIIFVMVCTYFIF